MIIRKRLKGFRLAYTERHYDDEWRCLRAIKAERIGEQRGEVVEEEVRGATRGGGGAEAVVVSRVFCRLATPSAPQLDYPRDPPSPLFFPRLPIVPPADSVGCT